MPSDDGILLPALTTCTSPTNEHIPPPKTYSNNNTTRAHTWSPIHHSHLNWWRDKLIKRQTTTTTTTNKTSRHTHTSCHERHGWIWWRDAISRGTFRDMKQQQQQKSTHRSTHTPVLSHIIIHHEQHGWGWWRNKLHGWWSKLGFRVLNGIFGLGFLTWTLF